MGKAKESLNYLSHDYEVYIVCSIQYKGFEVIKWITTHLGKEWLNRFIYIRKKNLLRGDYFISKSRGTGIDFFRGKVIMFGSKKYTYWQPIIDYLELKLKL